jgi:hypothetical protein
LSDQHAREDDERLDLALEQLDVANRRWVAALRAHRGFVPRLRELADAAEQQAGALRLVDLAGGGWQPRKGASRIRVGYELRAESGRPGPPGLWRLFDRAVTELGQALEGVAITAVERSLRDLAEAARELVEAIEREIAAGQRESG